MDVDMNAREVISIYVINSVGCLLVIETLTDFKVTLFAMLITAVRYLP